MKWRIGATFGMKVGTIKIVWPTRPVVSPLAAPFRVSLARKLPSVFRPNFFAPLLSCNRVECPHDPFDLWKPP